MEKRSGITQSVTMPGGNTSEIITRKQVNPATYLIASEQGIYKTSLSRNDVHNQIHALVTKNTERRCGTVTPQRSQPDQDQPLES